MDYNQNNNTVSNKITYSIPKPGEGKYFYGTDIEKIYNSLGDSSIFTVNAKDLSEKMEEIGQDLRLMQDNISNWSGDASSNEAQTMRVILNNFEVSLGNIQNTIEPACEKINEFKELIAIIKEKEEALEEAQTDYYAIDTHIRNLYNIESYKEMGIEIGAPYNKCEGIEKYEHITDVSVLNSMLEEKRQLVEQLQLELDDLLVECAELYEEIKAFENELQTFEFIIGPDYKGIYDDKERFDALPLLTQYLLLAGDCGSNQSSPEILMEYIPKLLGEDYLNIVDENGFLPEEYGILAQKYNNIVRVMHQHGIYDNDEMILCAQAFADVGCGYAAITNIIFDLYKDSSILFESSYGFPMYYLDDQNRKIYNYEPILLDCYLTIMGDKETALYGSSTDRFLDEDDLFDSFLGYIASRDPIACSKIINEEIEVDEEIVQPNVDSSLSVTVEYEGGIYSRSFEDSSSYTKDDSLLTNEGAVQLYQERSKDYNYAVIALYNFELTPYGSNAGTEKIRVENAGHYMQIIGVSENGNFIVSSWGREFELTDYSFVDTVEGSAETIGREEDYTRAGKIVFFKVGE